MTKRSWSTGTGDTDSEALLGWILKSRDHIKKLYISVEYFVNWMANQNPPWAAYQAFMPGRLMTLDKLPGVNPVGVRETWYQISSKCIIKVTVSEAPRLCKDDQLWVGLKSVIDGLVHRVQSIWEAYLLTQGTCSMILI